jgi:hypothetical protein
MVAMVPEDVFHIGLFPASITFNAVVVPDA